jgi:hypothetical protein
MDAGFEALLGQIRQGHRQPESDAPPSNYDKFLSVLLSGEHPRFCELVWDGQVFLVVLTVHFQKPPERDIEQPPSGGPIQRRAWHYFRQFDPAEQAMMSFRVVVKDWLPVHAIVTVRPDVAGVVRLGTARLKELQAA